MSVPNTQRPDREDKNTEPPITINVQNVFVDCEDVATVWSRWSAGEEFQQARRALTLNLDNVFVGPYDRQTLLDHIGGPPPQPTSSICDAIRNSGSQSGLQRPGSVGEDQEDEVEAHDASDMIDPSEHTENAAPAKKSLLRVSNFSMPRVARAHGAFEMPPKVLENVENIDANIRQKIDLVALVAYRRVWLQKHTQPYLPSASYRSFDKSGSVNICNHCREIIGSDSSVSRHRKQQHPECRRSLGDCFERRCAFLLPRHHLRASGRYTWYNSEFLRAYIRQLKKETSASTGEGSSKRKRDRDEEEAEDEQSSEDGEPPSNQPRPGPTDDLMSTGSKTKDLSRTDDGTGDAESSV